MALIDWIIVALFFIALAAIVIWAVRQKEESSADYFLAGRKAKWWAVGSSIFSSNIGSEHLVGLAGAGAASGMAMAHWEMQGWLILVLGWVFVPFYERAKVFTMPEFLEKRYNKQSRTFLSVISLISYVLTKISVTVFTGGIVLKTVLGIDSIWGIDFFWIGAILLVLVTGIYSILGGMKAILYTSVFQTPILIIGSLIIVTLGIIKAGGWSEIELTMGDKMHLIRSASDGAFPWPGVIFGSAIIGFWYWCTDQFIVQRTLSAANEREARRGSILGGYLKLLPVFLFLVPGMIAYTLSQKGLIVMENTDAAYPSLIKSLLPAGIKGLVIIGVFAALMSSLASKFNSSATLFTVDFYKKYRPEVSEKHLVKVGRWATFVIVILGLIWIPVMKSIADVLYEYLQNVQSLIAPSIAVVFLLGIFSRKITPAAGFAGLISGFIVGMARLSLLIFHDSLPEDGILAQIAAINWLYFCIYLFIFSAAVVIGVSFFTKKPTEEQLQGLTFASASDEQKAATRASWNYWDVFHTVMILGLIIAFYAYFW